MNKLKRNTFGDKIVIAGILILAFSMIMIGGILFIHSIHTNKNNKIVIPTYTISSHIHISKRLGRSWTIGTMTTDIIIDTPTYSVFGYLGNLLGLNSNIIVKGSMKDVNGNMIISKNKLHFGLYGTEIANLKFTNIGKGNHYITIEVINNNNIVATKIFQINIGGDKNE